MECVYQKSQITFVLNSLITFRREEVRHNKQMLVHHHSQERIHLNIMMHEITDLFIEGLLVSKCHFV